ncbi:hypothetical protein [Leptolyngbya sp. FACHB-261]|uniref:hypothetical protein n=1 Tax=Leptolyngbya sp. FACHB-261 TaxID=2692806 RepID=UPI0016876582|nr:hypothetical protein [Leptolyngbya sp. FACHB-261]MBD2100143.1 hypothetical protein [Leptolyngbya sp. FACHB-261]
MVAQPSSQGSEDCTAGQAQNWDDPVHQPVDPTSLKPKVEPDQDMEPLLQAFLEVLTQELEE